MTEQTSAPAPTYAAAEPPFSGYGAPPAWTPVDPAGPSAAAPPAAPKRTFRDRLTSLRGRVVKLWLALAVGVACLVVGLGLGALVGRATDGSGTGQLQQPPGIGQGLRPDRQGLDGQAPGTPPAAGSGSTTSGTLS